MIFLFFGPYAFFEGLLRIAEESSKILNFLPNNLLGVLNISSNKNNNRHDRHSNPGRAGRRYAC